MTSRRPLRVAFFGTYDVRSEPRVRVLIEGFADSGDEVSEANVPLGLDTAARVRLLGKPWLLPVLAARLARRWVTLWRRARRLPPVDAVVVGYMGHFDVLLARRLFRGTPVVLDHLVSAAGTARDRGLSNGWKDRLLAGLDRRALRAADVVAVDTDEHFEALPAEARPRAVVVPVGAASAWFEARDEAARAAPAAEPGTGQVAGAGRLRVVFMGRFTPLQGATVIGEALASLADAPLDVTMIGNGQDLEAARAAAGDAPNVVWLDRLDPTPPSLLASHDVSLGIFGTTDKALLVVPNKVFQGAAAGCAIVTSDTPPQRRALGDAAVFVPPGDARALADALRRLAGDPDAVADLRRRARALADAHFRPDRTITPLRTHLLEGVRLSR